MIESDFNLNMVYTVTKLYDYEFLNPQGNLNDNNDNNYNFLYSGLDDPKNNPYDYNYSNYSTHGGQIMSFSEQTIGYQPQHQDGLAPNLNNTFSAVLLDSINQSVNFFIQKLSDLFRTKNDTQSIRNDDYQSQAIQDSQDILSQLTNDQKSLLAVLQISLATQLFNAETPNVDINFNALTLSIANFNKMLTDIELKQVIEIQIADIEESIKNFEKFGISRNYNAVVEFLKSKVQNTIPDRSKCGELSYEGQSGQRFTTPDEESSAQVKVGELSYEGQDGKMFFATSGQ